MIAQPQFRWADPHTWPWIVWAWLAMIAAGSLKPIWKWFQKQRAIGWPTVPGRIESVDVRQPSTLGRRSPTFTADMAYSYSVEGQYHAGHYRRTFGSEQEGWEFVRDLQGKPVMVSYNPRKPAKSSLTEDAVATLVSTRPPLPEGSTLQVPVSTVPGWMKPLLWPFIVLSVVGLALSLWVHFGAVAGRKVAPEALFWMLHLGIFIVWVPVVLVATKRVGSARRKDFWKVVLRGSPEWMRYMVYGFLSYAVVNFLIFMPQAPKAGTKGGTPAVVWRGFSGHWMAFYSAALAILYAAAHQGESTVRTRITTK